MSLLLFLLMIRQPMIRIEGETMATTYHITYYDSKGRNFKKSVDSLFVLVNKSINTYDPASEISFFNHKPGIWLRLPYLRQALERSKEVYEQSHGAFDPTVMPLVNAWGFGYEERGSIPDSAKVDSLRMLVGFNKVQIRGVNLIKTDERVTIDLGGIGQGFGADVIANFLKSKGVENMFVELGGEGMAIGHNTESGKPWRIAILDPEDTHAFKAYVSLTNRSFTTSGNYYNFREVNGQKFSHTIDPATGYPAQRAILSASVFAKDCATADAWATAFMVMGHEKAIETLKHHPELDAFFVYSTDNGTKTFVTKGISRQLEFNDK